MVAPTRPYEHEIIRVEVQRQSQLNGSRLAAEATVATAPLGGQKPHGTANLLPQRRGEAIGRYVSNATNPRMVRSSDRFSVPILLKPGSGPSTL